MTVESGGVEGGGGGDGAADGGGSSTTDGDAPPKKPPSEQPPRPGTPSAAHAAAVAGGGRPAETGCKLLCDTDAGDPDDPEDDEILEESPCKRWSKRREKVKQRDVPGIDAAYLAMDNETGNEVVWNEVLFSERKNFRDQEEKIRAVFDNLIRLEHPNLVKFHKYWMDTKSDKPRIIFITEYMSSGSMSRFLQRARSSGSLLNIKAWKNWTRQILSALSYLHSCDPPIVHANLTSTSVFIQQNGLVKIGCVAPKTIHHHVKTFRENIKNVHYLAPEYDHQTETTIQADIYSFGVCALEMATTGALQSGCFNGASTSAATALTGLPSTASTSALLGTVAAAAAAAAAIEKEKTAEPGGLAAPACGISSSASSSMLPVPAGNGVQPPQGSGAAGGGGGGSCFHMVTEEMVQKALHSLDQPEQKQFIERCLEHDPARRANVIELLDRLGPPEPDPDDTFDHNQHSQHEDGYITNHHHPHNFVVSAATNTAGANATSIDINSLSPAVTTAPATITTTVAPAAVPSITTSNATQTLSSATTTTTTTISSTIATIMTGSLTTTTAVANNNINGGGNINGMLLQHNNNNTNALGNGGGVAAPTMATTATDEGYHTNQSIVDGGGGGGQSALMNTSAFVNAVGGSAFGSSLHGHGHGHAETTVNGGCGVVVDPANVGIVQLPLNREMRQVVQLHAELLEPDSEGVATKLRVQLQLDDQMNRQLTASLREGDTADSLAADLVQNGFVSEANSSKVCELLTNVMSSRTVQLQQLRGRRGSSAASAEESSLPLVFKEVMNVDSGNGRIVGEKEETKETTATRRRASPTHIQQQ